ncbi:MAG: hypothetical protein ACI9CO_002138 [Candidatus Azotimanducaceae bacterium]|jgi:hypothetical protein
MSILVLQTIIKQWDKSERTEEYVSQRAKIPDQFAIEFPPAFYSFNNQCVIDQHGDDLFGDRITYSECHNGKIKFDRFQVCLNSNVLAYAAKTGSEQNFKPMGSLDNTWIQCKYDWRYSVYEGGFYYWLYEAVVLNAISISTLNKNVFLGANSKIILTQ